MERGSGKASRDENVAGNPSLIRLGKVGPNSTGLGRNAQKVSKPKFLFAQQDRRVNGPKPLLGGKVRVDRESDRLQQDEGGAPLRQNAMRLGYCAVD